jgi:hypothetical protein
MVGPVSQVALERGRPDAPYLAHASGIVRRVRYDDAQGHLDVQMQGMPGQVVDVRVVAPSPPQRVLIDGVEQRDGLSVAQKVGACVVKFSWTLTSRTPLIRFEF